MRHSVKVYLWGIEIGTLSSDTTGRPSFFYFSPALTDEIKAAFPVGFPADMLAGKLPVYGEDRPPYDGVPPFISDSLPDSWGNELFEQWRTANKISNREISVCDKLAFIGVRGMGALGFQPQEAIRLKNGHKVAQARIEMAYRSGSFHLLADIDGRLSKYVINKSCPEYESLLLNGVRSLDEGSLRAMISRYLLKK